MKRLAQKIEQLAQGKVGRVHYIVGTILAIFFYLFVVFPLVVFFTLLLSFFIKIEPWLYFSLIGLFFIPVAYYIHSLTPRRLNDIGWPRDYFTVMMGIPLFTELFVRFTLLFQKGRKSNKTYL